MPLDKSSSPGAFKKNIKTLMHDVGKSPHVQSRKQAIAIAYATARRYGQGKAGGGSAVSNLALKGSSIKLGREGMLNSPIPGRTDKIPLKVRAGSYVLPGDIPSALGQGNSAAGAQILKNMFSSGPYGLPTMHAGHGPIRPRLRMKANGGEIVDDADEDHVPIIAAGGEFIISPDVVKAIGHGNMKKGHEVLDRLVLKIRKENIKTLKSLPPPKK